MVLKDVFDKAEDGTLTYEKFLELAGEAKFVDLSEGQYVSKGKYSDELKAKDEQINSLNETLTTRDTDLKSLKSQLEAAGTDADKLNTLTNDFTALQSKYDADVKNYKAQLDAQAYDFAVREYASTKDFSSGAARKEFIRNMSAEKLKVKDGEIMGADDFFTLWAKANPDALKVKEAEHEEAPQPFMPQFISSTQGTQPSADPTGGFADAFHFTGVRAIPNDGEN